MKKILLAIAVTLTFTLSTVARDNTQVISLPETIVNTEQEANIASADGGILVIITDDAIIIIFY